MPINNNPDPISRKGVTINEDARLSSCLLIGIDAPHSACSATISIILFEIQCKADLAECLCCFDTSYYCSARSHLRLCGRKSAQSQLPDRCEPDARRIFPASN